MRRSSASSLTTTASVSTQSTTSPRDCAAMPNSRASVCSSGPSRNACTRVGRLPDSSRAISSRLLRIASCAASAASMWSLVCCCAGSLSLPRSTETNMRAALSGCSRSCTAEATKRVL
ncbi:hypothetical protein G6F65_023050 [Rhizopus arrhizus]|nr:hypothetical protein G6F65_023050 [Rhizopus arrhizus]